MVGYGGQPEATPRDQLLAEILAVLAARRNHDGGFLALAAGGARPDATAWAVILLRAGELASDWVAQGSRWLQARQAPDGRVSIAPDYLPGWWPTPLAVWAWLGNRDYAPAREAACRFLLRHRGQPVRDHPGQIDPRLRGWSYVAGTFSWVEPTALAVYALSQAGYGTELTVREGITMLLDRQLPGGGWNYGNTIIFGQRLRPAPEHTGLALWGLAGQVPHQEVAASLAYLEEQLSILTTPLALSWTVLGLAAWRQLPAKVIDRLLACWQRWRQSSLLDTATLCLLGLAALHGDPAR